MLNVRRALAASRNFVPSFRSKAVIAGLFAVFLFIIGYLMFFKTNIDMSEWRNVSPGRSLTSAPTVAELLSDVRIKPMEEVPVSPLELIPDIEQAIDKKRQASWDVLFRNKKYKSFASYDLNQKCEFYFQNVYNMNEDWSNDIRQFTFDIKEEEDLKKVTDMKDGDGIPLLDAGSLRLYRRKHDFSLGMERLRLYEKCFVTNPHVDKLDMSQLFGAEMAGHKTTTSILNNEMNAVHKKTPDSWRNSFFEEMDSSVYKKFDQWDFEHRMFPMIPYFTKDNFTNVMPIFTGPTPAEPLPQGTFPVFDRTTGKFVRTEEFVYNPKKSLWRNWSDMSSKCTNRGIVLSAGNGQVDLCMGLLATLRAQNNKLPIQLIHNDQLSDESMRRLSEAATSMDFSSGPAQSLWFVNVKSTIVKSMVGNFSRFKNKWLSVMFNTFEEYIFIDADAISYINVEDYFNFKEYTDTGTLMFKDRSLTIGTGQKCPALFETLEPKVLEMIYFQNYPIIDATYVEAECTKYLTAEEKVYKKFFQTGHQHNLESGLLAIDNKKHLMGIITAMFLNISPKIGGCGWGDKEFFWLGLLVAGHEYSIYDIDASAVGIVDQKKFVKKGDDMDQYQICSLQVAHTSYDRHLLWLNGGSQYCKKPSYFESDWEKLESFRNTYSNDKEKALKAYSDIVNIEAAIVPDEKGGEWYREDSRCNGYFWCGKYTSKPKPYTYDKKVVRGDLIRFDQEEISRIRNVNAIWNEALKAYHQVSN